jgi:tol-pal system protein YbgF
MTSLPLRALLVSVTAATLLAGSIAAFGQSSNDGSPGFLGGLFGGNDRAAPTDPGQVAQANPGDLTRRVDRLEATIRQLTGAIEELQYHNQQLADELRRLEDASAPTQGRPPVAPGAQVMARPPVSAPPPSGRRDVFDPAQDPNAPGAPRTLGAIAGTGAPPPDGGYQPPVGAPGGRAAGEPLDLSTLSGKAVADPALAPAGSDAGAQPRNPAPGGAQVATLPPTDSPKDNYDLAYGYMLHKDYALAEDAFRTFLRKYPSDRQAPDAEYWLGESLFQRQRYRDAAESFLNVSTKYESTAKAPDALLRLGQSLAELGEKEAACASLGEVLRKYPRAALSVKQGVDREQKRAGC